MVLDIILSCSTENLYDTKSADTGIFLRFITVTRVIQFI